MVMYQFLGNNAMVRNISRVEAAPIYSTDRMHCQSSCSVTQRPGHAGCGEGGGWTREPPRQEWQAWQRRKEKDIVCTY